MCANRKNRHGERVMLLCLLSFFTIALCSAEKVGAQTEKPAVDGGLAATRAREQLEIAFASEDSFERNSALRVARFINEPWIAEIVLPLCQSPDILERAMALEIVTNTNPALGKTAFLEALTSEERGLRLRGLLGLSALGDPSTISSLVKIMTDDPDPDLQASAARALGNIGDIKASIPLYGAINNSFPPVREQAVLALITIGDENLGRFLSDKLQKGHFPGEVETLRLMALVPDPALISVIEPFLMDTDPVKRTLAAAAILSILERSGSSQS